MRGEPQDDVVADQRWSRRCPPRARLLSRGANLSDPRRQTRRIAFGTAARLVGRTLGAVISLLALREATRYFGPVQWGPITAALAWFTVFSYLGSPGLATLTMREIARPRADVGSVFGQALKATLMISLGAALVSLVLALPVYWGRSITLSMVLILAPGVPLTALFLTSGSVLVGTRRSGTRALLDLVSSAFLLGATLFVVDTQLRPRGYAVAFVASLAATALAAVALAVYAVRPKFNSTREELVGMLRASLPLGQFDLFAVVYARADSIMLFLIKGSRPTAWYGLAFQIATFLFALPALLANTVLPDFMSESIERRHFLARRALDVLLTISLPLPVFGVVFARPFVIWLAGKDFSRAGPLLAILTIAAAISLVNGYLFQMAVYAGAEKGLWRAVGVVTAANLAANAVAVSVWGATGAAVVMILSEAVGLGLYWHVYRTTMPSPLGRRYPLSVVLATLGLIGTWWALHAGLGVKTGIGVGILPRVAGLMAIYFALVWGITTCARRLTSAR